MISNTEKHLQQAQEIEAKATPAQWRAVKDCALVQVQAGEEPVCLSSDSANNFENDESNSEFIAFSRNTFAQRTEAIRAMKMALERIHGGMSREQWVDDIAREALEKVENIFKGEK